MNATTLRRGASSVAPFGADDRDGTCLILGPPDDALGAAVIEALRAMDCDVRQLPHPFASPHHCSWSFDSTGGVHELLLEGERLTAAHVRGVLVRGQPMIDPDGWEEKDLGYAYAELHAAVLGWMHGLSCPVVNRYPSWTWFRRGPRLSDWYPSLRAAGVPFQDALLTSDVGAARAFSNVVVLNPMTAEAAWLMATDGDWRTLSQYVARTPAHLTRPHGPPRFATVVGDIVFWSAAPEDADALEAALVRFARDTGLALVEVAFADVDGGLRAVGVDAFPTLDHQPSSNHAGIAAAVALLLTGEPAATPAGRLP